MNPNPENDSLPATNAMGHRWTGESEKEQGVTWWNYVNPHGNEYQSPEVPAFRIVLNNAAQMNGIKGIMPLGEALDRP